MAERTNTATTPGARTVRYSVLAALGVVAVFVFLCDQGAKYLVENNLPRGESVPILGELLQFTYVLNPGAAFSLFSGTTWVFAIIATAVAVFIVVFARRIHSMAWGVLFGLLLGGNLGNLFDRLFREPGFGIGHVVDFIQIWGFPAIFNIADIGIVSSMGLFIILTIRGVGFDGKRVSSKTAAVDAAADDSPAADADDTRS